MKFNKENEKKFNSFFALQIRNGKRNKKIVMLEHQYVN